MAPHEARGDERRRGLLPLPLRSSYTEALTVELVIERLRGEIESLEHSALMQRAELVATDEEQDARRKRLAHTEKLLAQTREALDVLTGPRKVRVTTRVKVKAHGIDHDLGTTDPVFAR